MKRTVTTLAVAMILGASMGSSAIAQVPPNVDQHPEVAQQLKANPQLVDNRQYVQNHPGLHEFLENHPDARAQCRSHPYKFTCREDRYDRNH